MRCGWPQCLRGVVRGTISLVRPTVLIVDDHEAFRASARALLQAGGFDVIGEASDGTKAIAAVTALRPAIVLLDHVSSPRGRPVTGWRHARGASRPVRGGVAIGPGPVAARAGSCGGRRGSGRWPTGPVTACCPAGGRSPASTVGRSAGVAWSNGPARQANSTSAVNLANQACIWSGHNSPSATGPNNRHPLRVTIP